MVSAAVAGVVVKAVVVVGRAAPVAVAPVVLVGLVAVVLVGPVAVVRVAVEAAAHGASEPSACERAIQRGHHARPRTAAHGLVPSTKRDDSRDWC